MTKSKLSKFFLDYSDKQREEIYRKAMKGAIAKQKEIVAKAKLLDKSSKLC